MNSNYCVLLYYKFIEIKDPERVRDEQKELCASLNLKGRIIVGNEGINGTVEGLGENTEKYIQEMDKNKLFKNISYKKSAGTGTAFSKLSVKVRPEIVTSGISSLSPNRVTGNYITADELHDWFEQKKDFYIVDMRNEYEYSSGYFEGFIPSGLQHFFNLSQVVEKLQHLKNKTIVTVCTGGIRCEKASGLLVENGFNKVYQLQDGIQTYMEKYPNEHFKGKLYVFDNRITIGFNTDSPKHEIVGVCKQCKKACDTYVNCEYNECHKHYICCNNCKNKETGLAFCDNTCRENYLSSVPISSLIL